MVSERQEVEETKTRRLDVHVLMGVDTKQRLRSAEETAAERTNNKHATSKHAMF